FKENLELAANLIIKFWKKNPELLVDVLIKGFQNISDGKKEKLSEVFFGKKLWAKFKKAAESA
ncbi:MAG: hypothetical protein UV70_C0026G0001, partial [Parcubacteria group bacterium GW2011_GWA2_43_13]